MEGQPRERLEARWQIMMFAAGRVAPALRGRQSCRTNDRSRPTARRTSSGRARGSRASNKPCPRASLLHRVPNKRNRVDARAFGREWFLESWFSGQWASRGGVYREVILKGRRTIFLYDVTIHASSAPSSFLAWIKGFFGDGRRLAHLLDRGVRLLRHGASICMEHAAPGSVLRASRSSNASSGPPRPAGRRPRERWSDT